MFDFFEEALKLAKSDEAILAIVVVVALIIIVTVLKKRSKTNVDESFSKNNNTCLWYG